MREPLAQPLTIDGAQTVVRNPARLVDSFGLAGIITMWSGPTPDIPPGWALCDGNNDTPDLHDRFIPPVVFIIKL